MRGIVLYADDDLVSRKALKRTLETSGFEVECAADGQEALDLLRASPGRFSAVITDHEMPRMTGLELVRHLTWCGLFPERIIVLSSAMPAEARFSYHELPIHSILDKPIRPALLVSALLTILAL